MEVGIRFIICLEVFMMTKKVVVLLLFFLVIAVFVMIKESKEDEQIHERTCH